MATIMVRGLEESVKEQMKARAKRNGRSLEGEMRMIINNAAIAADDSVKEIDTGSQIRKIFDGSYIDLAIEERDEKQRRVTL